MDLEVMIRGGGTFIGLVAAGAGAFKNAMDLTQLRSGRLREEYKFAREFFADYKKDGAMHPFLKTKGLQAIAGTTDINPSEIQYLLTLKGAPQAIKNYVFGKKYLQHLEGVGNLQVDFKDRYKSPRYRKLLKGWYLFWYGLSVFAAGSPFIFSSFFARGGVTSPGLLLVTLAFFSPYAFLALRAGVRVSRAEHLVSTQEAHTQAIIVPMGSEPIVEPSAKWHG
ncbi:MAG: hypothetical protein EPO09_21130 [Aquabacterium sp.]|uniref:hypothetical protein n=1 Tax=Aquabacterium sp. TaxID=1872578 RepID=UPI001216946B|nr:hypothetical protein [Aquabacterium sp.]TAK84004.1 MAG: hypothetical protein EPO09_21130 [Aquabacterium sp.]